MLYTLFISLLITKLKQLIYKQAPELLGKGRGGWVSAPQQSSVLDPKHTARSPQPRVSPSPRATHAAPSALLGWRRAPALSPAGPARHSHM